MYKFSALTESPEYHGDIKIKLVITIKELVGFTTYLVSVSKSLMVEGIIL